MRRGDVLDSRFTIEEEAGAGAMGVVYRARDGFTGETVAIKVLKGKRTAESRFSREAKVLAQLEHPAIVRYVSHGATADGARWLAMEWLEGGDLEERLRDGGRLDVAEALALARRVADALGAAHARGVVHRDLKPGNLLVPGGDPRAVKLVDFGVARLLDASLALTAAGAIVGTPGYMAPEQARGDARIDARADVFALGCVLFECLTGRAAFVGDNVIALLAKIVLEDPPPPSELRSGVPPVVDALVAGLLAKAPSDRPRDGGEARLSILAVEDMLARDPSASIAPSKRPAAITRGEQHVVSVVIATGLAPAIEARTSGEASVASLADGSVDPVRLDPSRLFDADTLASDEPATLALLASVERMGARVEHLADGAVVATILGTAVATDQAAQAARCAIALRRALPDAPIVLATGRGVFTGRIPLGPVIEKAARMVLALPPRAAGAPAPIHLDDVTAALLPSRFRVRAGAAGAELDGEERGADVARTLLGKPTPFVGRDPEMSTLSGVFAQVESELVARAIVVTGAPGLGKSRLREELVSRLRARDPAPEIWLAVAEPLAAGAPLGLLARVVRSALGIVDESPGALDRAALVARIARHVPASDVARVATFLGELLGLERGEPDVLLEAARREPALMAEQIQRAFAELLAAECAARPVVVVLEDAQWSDPPTMKLLDRALRELAERPLLVVAFARPEIEDAFPGLFAERSVLRVALGPLTTRAAERLAREALGDVDAVRLVVQQAAGNPFFLEELVRATATGIAASASMPESLVAIVQSRLEAHDEDSRRVMRAASVFGGVFWRAGATALLGAARDVDTQRRIDDLAAREIFVRHAESRLPGQLEIAFRHALVRDAAYGMLTDADRALAHRLAGAWLERAGEMNRALLGEHFELGGERARATEHWLAAAAHALETDDLDGALRLSARGLALEPRGELRGLLQLARAEALRFRGDLAGARSEADAALALLARGEDDWLRALGVSLAASVTTGAVERGLALAEELVAQSARSDVFFMTAARAVSFLLGAGQRAAAERLFALLPDGSPEPLLAARIHVARAMHAHVVAGDVVRLHEEMSLAAAAFDRAGDVRSACSSRSNAAYACLELGRFEDAEALLDDALTAARVRGADNIAAWATYTLGLVRGGLGRIDDAIALERDALAAAQRQEDRRLEANANVALARLVVESAPERAENLARRALEAAGATPSLRAHALAVLVEALLASGKRDDAHAFACESMALLTPDAGLEDAELHVRAAHAASLHALGRRPEARESLAVAVARIEELAARLAEPDARARFLTRVALNARILRLAAAWSTEPA